MVARLLWIPFFCADIGSLGGAWTSSYLTEISPERHVAALYGITGAVGTLAGAIAQPVIGATVDRLGYTPVFAGTAVVFVIAIGLLLAAGKIERIGQPAEGKAEGVSMT
jgi:MFS family permease